MKYCNVDGCDKPYHASGWCRNHYAIVYYHLNNNFVATHHHKHGMRKTSEWNSWTGMKTRCYNTTSNPKYASYGGRGIKVCDRWLEKPNGFLNFLEDMGKKPGKSYSLNRIDNDGDYEPSNCEWATPHAQAMNTRQNNPTPGVRRITNKQLKNEWYARIMINSKVISLGYYATEAEAIAARKNAELLYLHNDK